MPKKAGIFLVIVGTVLILSALSLLLYNWHEDVQAGENAENLLQSVNAVLEQRDNGNDSTENPTEETEETEPLDPEMPVVMIDGYGYVGTLSIPALDLELPVMSEWDYNRLQKAPCRQFGSCRTDDLVIAAHNFKTHFGLLKNLVLGDSVSFTDMDGIVYDYTVDKMAILQPTDIDGALNSGYDLVLYTCTQGGETRVTVFCNRVVSGSTEK